MATHQNHFIIIKKGKENMINNFIPSVSYADFIVEVELDFLRDLGSRKSRLMAGSWMCKFPI